MIFRRSPAELPREGDIRRAERRDVPRLVELWLHLMSSHEKLDHRFAVSADAAQVMTRRFQQLLQDHDTLVLVVEANHIVVGFAAGHIDVNLPFLAGSLIGFISDVYVLEEFRRQGRASRLVSALRDWFRSRKVSSIQLHAAACNSESRDFWRRMGFSDYLVRMWEDV